MKIAMIGQKGIPATYGGIERHVEEIARRLVAMGHQVDVFCRLHYTAPGTTCHDIHLLRRPSVNTKHFDTLTHVVWATVEAMMFGLAPAMDVCTTMTGKVTFGSGATGR
mgnify:CR=1 FL=1